MRIDCSVLDPPLKHILDVLNRASKVMFKLILGLGVDRGRNGW